MSDSEKPLSPRKRKYVDGRAKGLSKKDAALAAGYSESVALKAKSHIETPEVRAAFAQLMRKKIPAERIAQRISEGLDAMETKFFQKDGVVTDRRDVIAWSERRQYASLAAELGGYHAPPRQESPDSGAKVLIQFIRDPQTPAIQVASTPKI